MLAAVWIERGAWIAPGTSERPRAMGAGRAGASSTAATAHAAGAWAAAARQEIRLEPIPQTIRATRAVRASEIRPLSRSVAIPYLQPPGARL